MMEQHEQPQKAKGDFYRFVETLPDHARDWAQFDIVRYTRQHLLTQLQSVLPLDGKPFKVECFWIEKREEEGPNWKPPFTIFVLEARITYE